MKPVITFMLILIFGHHPISAQTKSIEPDKRVIEFMDEFDRDYTKAFLTERADIISSYHAEDVRLMPEFQKTIFTRENAKMYYNAFFERFRIEAYEREVIEILDLDNRIVVLGYFTLRMTEAENEYTLKGKYQNIWEKSAKGEMKLITEAWNYNHAVDFADRLRFKNIPSVHIALQEHLPVNDNISFELAALNALMELTISQGDARIWAQFFSDDGMFIYSFNPIYKGKKELEDYLTRHAGELPVFEHLDVRTDKIEELNGYVIEYATHIANWRNGTYSGVSTGKDIRIWRREKNGSLKILRQMAMYD